MKNRPLSVPSAAPVANSPEKVVGATGFEPDAPTPSASAPVEPPQVRKRKPWWERVQEFENRPLSVPLETRDVVHLVAICQRQVNTCHHVQSSDLARAIELRDKLKAVLPEKLAALLTDELAAIAL